MIRKPAASLGRESTVVTSLRGAAIGGGAFARAGGYYLRGAVCWCLALLWGFSAFAAGISFAGWPTVIGVGTMAVVMAWLGTRMFAKARDCLPARSSARSGPHIDARSPLQGPARHRGTGGNDGAVSPSSAMS